MSNEPSTTQSAPDRTSITRPGLEPTRSVPAMICNEENVGSPVTWPDRRNRSVENDCTGSPGVCGAEWISRLTGTSTLRSNHENGPVPMTWKVTTAVAQDSSPPRVPPGWSQSPPGIGGVNEHPVDPDAGHAKLFSTALIRKGAPCAIVEGPVYAHPCGGSVAVPPLSGTGPSTIAQG